MDTEPQPSEWVEDHDCEQRKDPAVALLNVTPDTERKLVDEVTQN